MSKNLIKYGFYAEIKNVYEGICEKDLDSATYLGLKVNLHLYSSIGKIPFLYECPLNDYYKFKGKINKTVFIVLESDASLLLYDINLFVKCGTLKQIKNVNKIPYELKKLSQMNGKNNDKKFMEVFLNV